MAYDMKSLRSRIRSVESTKKLTGAMGLVASSKMKKASEGMMRSREYVKALSDAVGVLTSSPDAASSVFMKQREGKTLLIVIAGDRGMAGGYNANVFRTMNSVKYDECIAIGKRAYSKIGRGYTSCEHFSPSDAQDIADKICARFASGEITSVYLLYTAYRSVISQVAELERILPLEKTKKPSVPVFEPDAADVIKDAVPLYVAGMINARARESFACEVASRRVAMDSAGKNASQMLDTLTLSYNRARQGAITQEITEIVAGSDA